MTNTKKSQSNFFEFHFFSGTPDFVRLGSTSNVRNVTGQAVEIDVQTFTTHPDYKYLSKFNDIALIKLDQDVTFNDFIRPACLHQLSSISGNVVAVSFNQFFLRLSRYLK